MDELLVAIWWTARWQRHRDAVARLFPPGYADNYTNRFLYRYNQI